MEQYENHNMDEDVVVLGESSDESFSAKGKIVHAISVQLFCATLEEPKQIGGGWLEEDLDMDIFTFDASESFDLDEAEGL